jgi:hypothetical protein
MAGWRADTMALGAALALHAVALGALRFVPEPAAGPHPRPSLEGIEVDLVTTTEPTRPIAAVPESGAETNPLEVVASLAPPRRVNGQRAGSFSDGSGNTGLEPDEGAGGGAASGHPGGPREQPSDGTTDAPSLSLAQLGVEGRLGYPIVSPPSRPSPRLAAETRLRRSMAQPVAQHDTELGLGAHGPIIGALEQAAHRGATPLNATALFQARVDGRGRIVQLTLLEASQGTGAWQEVGQHAAQALALRTLKVPDGSRGIVLDIRVVSREQLPSGADPGVGVSVFRLPIKRGKGEHSGTVDILYPELDLDTVEIPDPGGGEPLRLPRLKIGIALLNVGVDPADIGQHSRRVVHAEVVKTEPL